MMRKRKCDCVRSLYCNAKERTQENKVPRGNSQHIYKRPSQSEISYEACTLSYWRRRPAGQLQCALLVLPVNVLIA